MLNCRYGYKTLDQLTTFASIAEIFSAVTIVIGGIFAAFQFAEYRKRRRYQVAAELCRKFSDPDLGRAIALINRLPDNLNAEQMRALGQEHEESALIIAQSFETMGLLVFQKQASFSMIQQLTGGLLLMMYGKLKTWFETVRVESGNARFAEWMQWLAERIQEEEQNMVPAFIAHSNWRRTKN